MTTITTLVETLHQTIDEANEDIDKLEDYIDTYRHLISWNRGCIDHAEFTLAEIKKRQKTAIEELGKQ